MGLFSQSIVLRMSNPDYVIEKTALPQITKNNIDLTVVPGTVAVIGGLKYKGQEVAYKVTRDIIGSKKACAEAYLFPDKTFDSVSVTFFGGQHVVSISSLPKAKAKFSIVGTATVEVGDYKDLANFFGRSMTKEQLAEEINKNFRGHLSNEVSVAASKYITPETTEITLRAALENVAQDVMKSRKTASFLMNMGLILSARGISMHLNALEDADDKLRAINDALTDKAIASLDDDLLDRQERENAAARQHEIDLVRASRTNISETTDTKNVNTNATGNAASHVVINNNNIKQASKGKSFCTECGAELPKGSLKFCPNCGKKIG